MVPARRTLDRAAAASAPFQIVMLALGCSLASAPASAQTLYVAPEAGWSEHRDAALGGRIGAEVVGGLDLVTQGLVYFPEEEGVADPGVGVTRRSWQLGANALYAFDRGRALVPYVGAGFRYGRATLGVTVDGLRARRVGAGFDTHLLGGVRAHVLPGAPFVEYRGRDGGWTWTVGARWVLVRR